MDARDSKGGRTALLLAARGKHVECVKKLIENGANPDIRVSSRDGPEMIFDRTKVKYINSRLF